MVSVDLPTHALMLCGAAPGAIELRATVYSLLANPATGVRVAVGFAEQAIGHLWSSGTCLSKRLAGHPPEPLKVGASWSVADASLRVIRVPLDSTPNTWADDARPRGGLVLYARWTSVHIVQAGTTSIITGKPANLVSALVAFVGKPVPWDILADQVWTDTTDRLLLRKSFDSALRRLRVQLHELGVRDDFVSLDGSGNVELVLDPGDRMVDET